MLARERPPPNLEWDRVGNPQRRQPFARDVQSGQHLAMVAASPEDGAQRAGTLRTDTLQHVIENALERVIRYQHFQNAIALPPAAPFPLEVGGSFPYGGGQCALAL